MATLEFRTIEPKILYFGTPVALISSLNEDGTTNLAPMSLVLGVLDETKTAENLARHPECVVNIPSPELWKNVEELAPLTGKNPVPEAKAKQFCFEPHKFKSAGLRPLASDLVRPARARECPVQMEACVQGLHRISGAKLEELGEGIAAEVEIVRARGERLCPRRQVHRSGKMVAVNLQLPALLPPCRARTGKDISCGAIGVQA